MDFPLEIKDIQICTQPRNYSDQFIPAPIVIQNKKGFYIRRECNNDDDKGIRASNESAENFNLAD